MEKLYNKARDFYYKLTLEDIYLPYTRFREARTDFLKLAADKFNIYLEYSPENNVENNELVRLAAFITDFRSLLKEETDSSAEEINRLLANIVSNQDAGLLSELPASLKFEQEEKHYNALEGDNLYIRSIKSVKRGTLPVYRYLNKNRRYREREVPFADIVYYYFGVLFRKNYTRLITGLLKEDVKIYHSLIEKLKSFEVELSKNIPPEKEEIDRQLTAVRDFISELISGKPEVISQEKFLSDFNRLAALFRYSIDFSGTVSESVRKFDKSKSVMGFTSTERYAEQYIAEFENFFEALAQKIKLISDVFSNYLRLSAKVHAGITNYISLITENEIAAIKQIVLEIKKETQAWTGESDLKEFLENLKEKHRKILTDEEAVNLIEKIPYSGIKQFGTEYAFYLREAIDALDDEYSLIVLDDINFGVNPEKLADFDPQDIITTLFFRDTIQQAEKYEKEIELKYQQAVKNIIECPDIVEFNIDTAIDVLNNTPNNKGEAKKIAFEGISRVTTKVEDAVKILEEVNEEYSDIFQKTTNSFILEYRSVLNVKKVTAVIIQLSKERTIEKIKDSFADFSGKVKRFVPVILRRVRQFVSGTKNIYGEISRKVGLTESSGEISSEISDYLLEVESNVSKLPRVYQRLFRYEPLTDERFLIGREREMNQIKAAFSRWKHGHHASLAIIGEKGSGISTILNFASERYLPKKKYIRAELKNTIVTENELIQTLCKILNLEDVKTTTDLIFNLKIKHKGSTIIIENGEDLFLRKPSGFDAITSLLGIIAFTSGEIFWVISFNKYSWQYLTHTITIPDYFTNTVEIGSGNNKDIEQIIKKRHSVSGYKIVFEHGKQPRPGFNKLSEEQKQIELEKLYFETLTVICEGNVALALVFWLRSVSRFDKQIIYISDLNDLDFSFVKKLSDQKHFNLAAILLHDGLTIDEYREIFNATSREAELQFLALLDDGIIFRRSERFKINFLLYRQVVNSLKIKNILH